MQHVSYIHLGVVNSTQFPYLDLQDSFNPFYLSPTNLDLDLESGTAVACASVCSNPQTCSTPRSTLSQTN